MSTHKATRLNFVDTKRIGLFGGSFDPIHCGHIDNAKHIAKWLNLNSLALMPAYISPHKTSTHVSTEHRANMVELVCQQEPLLTLDAREIRKVGTSYTVDSLREMKEENNNATLFFMMGMDSLQTFTTWHCWQEILSLAHLVVCTRPGYTLLDINQETKELLDKHQIDSLDYIQERNAGCILFAPDNHIDASSTQIRSQLKKHLNQENLIPEAVLDYINRYKLYR